MRYSRRVIQRVEAGIPRLAPRMTWLATRTLERRVEKTVPPLTNITPDGSDIEGSIGPDNRVNGGD